MLQKIGSIIIVSGLILNNGLFIYSYYRISARLKENGITQSTFNPFGFYFQFRQLIKETSHRSNFEKKQGLQKIMDFVHRSLVWTIVIIVTGIVLIVCG